MTCGRYETQIALYAEGDLSPSSSRDVEQHLRGCPACQAFLNELKVSQSMLKSLSEETLDAACYDTVRQTVLKRLSPQKSARRSLGLPPRLLWQWRPVWAGGLMLLLCLGLAWQWPYRRERDAREQSRESRASPAGNIAPEPAPSLATGSSVASQTPSAKPEERSRSATPQMAANHEPDFLGEAYSSATELEHPSEPEVEQGTILDPEPPQETLAAPEEPPPLVIKLITDDPNIVIVWLVDQDLPSE